MTINTKGMRCQSQRTPGIKAMILMVGIALCLPQFALASTDMVTTIIYNLCDWLSGSLAVAIGVLACIAVGYGFLIGRVSKEYLLYVGIGLGLIIGGSYFAKSILLKGVA